ncbi:hypothetical protein EVAR_94362_1 [Eumeta japonica]|uniref:Uncharacterized protein n=1 Tax=Eumeta variegata TaxID=151549 RepID=A0A4C1TPZ0_EUMVA|nr:hypothetical protein EVAR_94362_1 [Eumeta japonica]
MTGPSADGPPCLAHSTSLDMDSRWRHRSFHDFVNSLSRYEFSQALLTALDAGTGSPKKRSGAVVKLSNYPPPRDSLRARPCVELTRSRARAHIS